MSADFSRTRWSLVLDPAAPPDAEGRARSSLDDLIGRYWYPAYAYARRSGHAPETAEALCEAFFAQLPAQVRAIDRQAPGRFRDFLLARLEQFLTGDWRDASEPPHPAAQAPSGMQDLEARARAELPAQASPVQAFQRAFALEVLARSLRRLREEAGQAGRADMFERLQGYLARDPDPAGSPALSEALGIQPLALVVAIKRMRQRFRELADEELMETVASPRDLDAERVALLGLLGGGPPVAPVAT